MPDGIILIRFVSEKYCGRVANDADGVRVGACAVRLHPAPNAGVGILTGAAVDQMELLTVYGEFQMICQARKKTKDAISLLGCTVVEQFPVGGCSTVVPPQIPGADFIACPGCSDTSARGCPGAWLYWEHP